MQLEVRTASLEYSRCKVGIRLVFTLPMQERPELAGYHANFHGSPWNKTPRFHNEAVLSSHAVYFFEYFQLKLISQVMLFIMFIISGSQGVISHI